MCIFAADHNCLPPLRNQPFCRVAGSLKRKRMHRIILLLLFLATAATGKSQAVNPGAPTAQGTDSAATQALARTCLRRNHTLKALAWTSVSVGTVAMVGGFIASVIIGVGDADLSAKYSPAPGIVMLSGLALATGSIHMFILAHKYKKKYRALQRMSLGSGLLRDPLPAGTMAAAPCLTARLSF